MKHRIVAVLLTVVCLFTMCCFTSCSIEKEYPVKIGETELEAEPTGIVVLDKNLADIISCIGYDIKMVGKSDDVNQEVMDVVPNVGSKTEPDVNKILKTGADLVIADKIIDVTQVKKIEEAGVPVVQFDVAQTKVQLKNEYENIGRVLGGNITGVAKGRKAYNELDETLENIQSAAEYDAIVKTVCYLYISDGVLKTMNNGTWGNIILKDTGAINVFEHAETNVVKTKELKIANPDFIFCSGQEVIDYLSGNEVLSELNALDNNTHIVPYDNITMQGYTSLDVLETILRVIYPNQFGD